MSARAVPAPPATAPAPRVTRRGDASEGEADRLAGRALDFRQPLPSATPRAAPASRSPAGGRPLDPAVRDGMGARLGHDLGGVRLHDDTASARAAGALGARAFTTGQDIHFAAGAYRPRTPEGRSLLTHELAHAVGNQPGVIARREAGVAEAPVTEGGPAERLARLLTEDPGDRSGEGRRLLRALSPADRAAAVRAAGARLGPSARGALAALALALALEDAPEDAAPAPVPEAAPPAAPATPEAAAPAARVGGPVPEAGAASGPGPGPGEVSEGEAVAAKAGPEPPRATEERASAEGEEATPEAGEALPSLASLLEPLPPEAAMGPLPPSSGPAAEPPPAPVTGETAETVPAPASVTGETGDPGSAVPATEAGDPQSAILATQEEALARILAAAAATRTALHRGGASLRAAIGQDVSRAADETRGKFAAARSALDAAVAAARAQIDGQLSARQAEAAARGTQAARDLADVFATHRGTVEGHVARAVTDAGAMGAHYRDMLGSRATEQANEARRQGQAQAAGYPGTERGGIQASAARGVANGVAAEIEARTPEALDAIAEVVAPLPDTFRQRGQEALDGFDEALPGLQQGASEAAAEVATALATLAQQAHAQLDAAAGTMRAELETAEAAAVAKVEAMGPSAAARLDAGLAAALRGVDSAVPGATAPVEGYGAEAVALLAAVPSPDPAAAVAFSDGVTGLLRGFAEEAEAAFGEAATALPERMRAALPPLRRALRGAARGTEDGLKRAEAANGAALSAFVEGVDDSYGSGIDAFDRACRAGQAEAAGRLAPAARDLDTGLRGSLTEAEGTITGKIDEALGKNDQALREMGPKMREAASDAAWDFDHPVLSTLRDIGALVLGVIAGILLVIALVVAVILAAKLAVFLLVAAGVSAVVAKVIVAVALIGYAVYQGYQAYSAHRDNGSSWYGALGRTAADMTGLTAMYNAFTQPGLTPFQRGLSFGEGAATLVTTFLGARRMGQRFRGRTPPTLANPAARGGAGAAAPPVPRAAAAPPVEPVGAPAAPRPAAPVVEPVPGPRPAAPVVEPAPAPRPSVPVASESPLATGPAPSSAPPRLRVVAGEGGAAGPPRARLGVVEPDGSVRPRPAGPPRANPARQAVPQEQVVAEAAGAEGMAPRPIAEPPRLRLVEPAGGAPTQAMASGGGRGGGGRPPGIVRAPSRGGGIGPVRGGGGGRGAGPARGPSGSRGAPVRPPPTTRSPVRPPPGRQPSLRVVPGGRGGAPAPGPGARPRPATARGPTPEAAAPVRTAAEPPVRAAPAEPLVRAAPAEPPARVALAEPPARATTAEPPARVAPAEPPVRAAPAEPPVRAPEPGPASRGHRPAPGERATTRAQWRAAEGARRWREGVAADIDRAFGSDAITRPAVERVGGKLRMEGRPIPRHQRRRLDMGDLPRAAGETRAQALTRVQQVIGHPISHFPEMTRVWNEARAHVTRTRPLRDEATSREVFDAVRNNFYQRLRRPGNEAARAEFERAGMEFTGADTTAPRLANAPADVPVAEVTISLDHMVERRVDWTRALDPGNLEITFSRPNSHREIVQMRHPDLRH